MELMGGVWGVGFGVEKRKAGGKRQIEGGLGL